MDAQNTPADASAAAHTPAGPGFDLFDRSANGGPKVDPQVLATAVAALQAGPAKHVVTPGHPKQDGTGGFNLRAAVAAALGLAPQYFTVRERQWTADAGGDGAWYWQVERRVTPTADRSKVTPAPQAVPEAVQVATPTEAPQVEAPTVGVQVEAAS